MYWCRVFFPLQAISTVELQELPVSLCLQPAEVPPNGSMILWRIKHSSQFFIFSISCIHCSGHWWRGHRQLFVAVPASGAHVAPSSRFFSPTSWAKCPFYKFSTSVCMNLSVMNFSSPLLSEAPASGGNLPGCQWRSGFQTCQQKTTGGSVGRFQFPTVTLFFLRNTWLLNF